MPADGHKILTISMPQIINNETWVLENFLPTAAKH